MLLRVEGGGAVELRLGEGGGVSALLRFTDGELSLDRHGGAGGMPEGFGSVERMPLSAGRVFDAEIWLDTSSAGRRSIEVFADDGAAVLTDLIGGGVTRLELVAAKGTVQVEELSVAAPIEESVDAGEGEKAAV